MSYVSTHRVSIAQLKDAIRRVKAAAAENTSAALGEAIASVYKAGGSKTAAELTSALLVAANEGKVYNISTALAITNSNKALFTENAEGTYEPGVNVAVIEATPADNTDPQNPVAATCKFDVLGNSLAGYVQNSDLATDAEVTEAIDELLGSEA